MTVNALAALSSSGALVTFKWRKFCEEATGASPPSLCLSRDPRAITGEQNGSAWASFFGEFVQSEKNAYRNCVGICNAREKPRLIRREVVLRCFSWKLPRNSDGEMNKRRAQLTRKNTAATLPLNLSRVFSPKNAPIDSAAKPTRNCNYSLGQKCEAPLTSRSKPNYPVSKEH